MPVQWDAVDPAVWKKRGTVTVTGSGTDVYGQTFNDAKVTVTVGKYTATDPVSATVGTGTTLAEVQAAAPATVPGQIGTGTARNSLAVTWDWSAFDACRAADRRNRHGPGKASTGVDGDKPLDAQLTVLVVDRVPSSHICKDDTTTTVTASYTEGSYIAKNTCDGNTSTRWSNWVSGGRSGDTLSYAFSRDYTVDSVTVTLAEKAAQSLTVQYQDATGAWKDTTAGTVTGLAHRRAGQGVLQSRHHARHPGWCWQPRARTPRWPRWPSRDRAWVRPGSPISAACWWTRNQWLASLPAPPATRC